MRRPSRRVLPTVIGVSLLTTLAANISVVVAQTDSGKPRTQAAKKQGFVASAASSPYSAVAPLRQRLSPHVLVAGGSTLPPAVIAKIRRYKGVKGVEVVDAVQALVGGKRVGLLGVEPSTFRSYTPKPTAESDALWRNVAAGDVAVSFLLGKDGGLQLDSRVPIGGKTRQVQTRVGAYATMGIGEVDGVVSHTVARSLGMPSGNALLISAPKVKLDRLNKWLTKKVLPKGAKPMLLNTRLDYVGGTGAGQLPQSNGQFMSAAQISVAIRAGYTKLGVPYVWGGESDAEGGYDCSGLVQWAFRQAGIKMPRVAASQALTGPIVPYAQARPGDLLIWANDPTAPGYISHIAIYIGDNKMLVAPHTGDVVKIQKVYLRNFRGAVRVNPRLSPRVAG
ncbi:C40 family peptidase [Actinomadura scrupuli]|uniref:C40 family peptidase n=1 Tax=Actinomadura scrupuli TaxID=559629 RepID=UPI003D97AF98